MPRSQKASRTPWLTLAPGLLAPKKVVEVSVELRTIRGDASADSSNKHIHPTFARPPGWRPSELRGFRPQIFATRGPWQWMCSMEFPLASPRIVRSSTETLDDLFRCQQAGRQSQPRRSRCLLASGHAGRPPEPARMHQSVSETDFTRDLKQFRRAHPDHSRR